MHTYITTEGIVIEFGPIGLLEREKAHQALDKKYRDNGELIDPPRYLIESDAGDTWADYDLESIKEGTEEEQEAWDKHIDALIRLKDEKDDLDTKIMCMKGIKNVPEDDAWEKWQESLGIEIPEDPTEKRIHWCQTVLLKTTRDVFGLTTQIYMLSGTGAVSEEEIRAAEGLFQDKMQELTAAISEA